MRLIKNELFLKVFMSNPCPMAISEISDGTYIEVNDALLDTLSYCKEEVIGKTPLELGIFLDSIDRQKMLQLLNEHGYFKSFETFVSCKNGNILNAVFNGEFITIEGRPYLLTVMNNITVKRQYEQEFIRLENLNLISQMSAGISHEIRNPITTVRGFLQFFMRKPAYAHHQDYFELMISELDKANSIITNFLSITESDPLHSQYIVQDLKKLLERIQPLLETNALEKHNRLHYCIADTPVILINEMEIRQMVFNLVQNGFDAMPMGGTLTLKTFSQDRHVVLVVQDHGTGIDETILDKLGTPFLTTKDHGTGLGLAVCYGIAHRHNAKINVTTSSRGTSFEVHFPIYQTDHKT
ncbi:Sporulation kinase A [Sporomusa ovata DSM 2662]|uniref:histidine kinase n=1 Tax=Sporomusa ovata TaxID=2378 RepID=A0A0U1L2L1_9FIRM|nr:PAS domain-containing sensor histidine kinase [Sporomusa ovata]EQB27324.1 sporulation kinase A [Sporomusa ovata DSM 2662]CQR73164.1 Sporulation kinase [Sporomusa ovata]